MKKPSMRATQIVSSGRTEIVDAPIPNPPEGHALVQPLLLAICGSDLHKIYHLPDSVYPLPPGISGHEVIGRIVSLNHGSTSLVGDLPQYPGGPVKEGDIVLALVPKFENAMAEYVTTEIENLLPLPSGTPHAHLLMAQQLGTVIFACKRLPNITGKDAVVIGQGSAGLFFNTMLRRLGAKKVVSMDLSDARVTMGRSFGANAVFNNHSLDPAEEVKREIGPQKADLVVEAVGEPETIRLMPKLVKKEGLLLYFGLPHAPHFEFNFMEWYWRCATSISCIRAGEDPGRQCFLQALELISSGEVDVEPMITHTFAFEEVDKAYQLAQTREDGAGKVLVKMPDYDK
ncbi:MAG: zinc-binding dehydrogenase [Proteobacteria bacterium]|nr:zinc-binding dehydrogenase [Pseudomonadota bacterium]